MWSTDQIDYSLYRIRALKGIQEAHREGTDLVFTTKAWALKHRLSLIPLPRFTVRINLWEEIRTRYTLFPSRIFHWHPTIPFKIGVNRYKQLCVGGYRGEMDTAYTEGPYEMVLMVLMFLQGVKAEDPIDVFLPWVEIGVVTFFIVFPASVIISSLL